MNIYTLFISLITTTNSTIFVFQKDDASLYQSTTTTLIAVIGVIICLVALIKWYFSGAVCKSKARLDGE